MKSALIQNLLRKNIIVSRRLGQNFLIDPNFLDYLVRAAGISAADAVIEIGSGPGILTGLIAQQAKTVIAVEIDRRLFSLARESNSRIYNVRFVNADILNKRQDGISLEVARQLESNAEYKILSNLPYKLAVPIIMTLLESHLRGELRIASMIVTVQLEVAQRLAAQTGSAEYNAVSILGQYLADIRILKKVPPDVFYPRPRVQSAVVSITPHNKASLQSYPGLKQLVSALFHYRRKTVRTALEKSGFAGKQKIEMLLSRAGLTGDTRPQDIPLGGYLKLVEAVI